MKRLEKNYSLLTDDYEYKMMDVYLKNQTNNQAVFEIFFRKIPNNGGYMIMSGLDKIIEYVNNIKFDDELLNYFRKNDYSDTLINYLKDFKFKGNIKAVIDGTPVFPNEPILQITGSVIECQIFETAFLSILNGAISHSTAARRIIEAAPKNIPVMEFGARRADGLEASLDSSIYGYMVGCAGTSNVEAARLLGIKAMGTMAHSFIETYDDELLAFRLFAKTYPENCILLVDTYDTLNSGIPNAIKTFKFMEENNIPTNNIGIRIDSGDLSYLSKTARKMLDEAGFPQAKICLSNGLDAYRIEQLIKDGACFNSLGVGDNISKPNGNVGCVYKEVAINIDNKFIPRIKLSEDEIKIINPGVKELYRAYDKNTGYALCDIITLKNEKLIKENMLIISPIDKLKNTNIKNFELKKLLVDIYKDGKLVYNEPKIEDKRKYCNDEMNKIYPEIKRLIDPYIYKVSATEEYVDMKYNLIESTKKNIKKIGKL